MSCLVPSLGQFYADWPDSRRHIEDSPAGRQATGKDFNPGITANTEPTIANIEITTRCTLGCIACARTQRKLQSRFMNKEDFVRVLEKLPHAFRVNLVGLGEPLLHPDLIDLIKIAASQNRRVGLVTNAMALDADMARALCASGLSSITFSVDAVDQSIAARIRPGSDMRQISANISHLTAERASQGASLATSVFAALNIDNINDFGAIVDFVADHGIDALMLTDLNFASNQARSVHEALTPEFARTLGEGLKKAFARKLPVLSVRGLEEFALDARYLDYLVLRAEQIAHRSPRRTNCLSPWQSIPVSVDGTLSLCDCQPDARIGNIHETPLSDWWNNQTMREQRQRMLGDDLPDACRVCPRL